MKYRADIEGLRGIAVSAVVLYHFGIGFPGGFVGVDVFFVVSGYLITGIINRQLQENRFSFKDFYLRRLRRIVPALAVIVFATVIVAWFILLPSDYSKLAKSVIAQPLMYANVSAWLNTSYFAPESGTAPLLHTWSLAVEEQFYLGFPLVYVLLWRKCNRYFLHILVTLALFSFALSVIATALLFTSASFYLLPTRAWELLLGAILAPSKQVENSVDRSGKLNLAKYRNAIGIASGALLLAVFWLYDKKTPFPSYHAALPCFATLGIIWSNQSSPTMIAKFLTLPILTFIGRISYSLYLIHWPTIVFYGYWNWETPSFVTTALLVSFSLFAAWMSYRFIETPFRNMTTKSPKTIFIGVGIVSISMIITGVIISVTKGFPSRFDGKILEWPHKNAASDYRVLSTIEDARNDRLHRIGDSNGELRCLLWGDSHAMAMAHGFETVLTKHKMQALQATHSSTPPVLDFNFENDNTRHLGGKTSEFAEAVVQNARKNRIQVVVLAANWVGYALDKKFEQAFLNSIKRLREQGFTIVIVKQVVVFPFDVPRSFARSIYRNETLDELGVLLADCRSAHSNIERIFSKLESDPRIIFLDPVEYFPIENDRILPVFQGKCLYRDTNHLSFEGSLLLLPMFEKILEITPQSEVRNPLTN